MVMAMLRKTQFGTLSIVGAAWLTLAGCDDNNNGSDTTDSGTTADSGPPADGGTRVDSGAVSDSGTGVDSGSPADSGTSVPVADAQVDASTPTASCDAGSAPCGDAAAMCSPIDQTYKFFYDGGLSQRTYTSEVDPGGLYQRVRTMGTSINTCNATLPACGSAAVDEADLSAALSNADVTAAFAAATSDSSMAYGVDSRPVDGQVFVVKRGEKQFAVGGPCNGATGCRAIPAGVSALVALLRTLDQEQNDAGPCAGF